MELGIIEQFADAIKQEPNDKKSTYSAIVSKIDEEGIIWVYVAGSDKETPTASSATEVKKGDTVTVEWRNNKLYIAGNYSNPSVGMQRANAIEETALGALNSANAASAAAASAKESAEIASGAAAKAVEDAASASAAASAASASAAAADAKATAAGNAASAAQQSADNAQTSASNASEYAARALGNLSTVQNVAETLNWITAHGTMTLTTDTALDHTHVYFVQDVNGDYTVGGTKYAIVTEPDVADISTYYELSIDESLNNYVATHLAVDSEGLWIIPDAGGNKVLIATGQGSTYSSAGTYIAGKVNDVDTVLAQFTKDGVQIGQAGETHTKIDYHSLKLIDKEGNTYFHVSDLRDASGKAEIVETTYSDGDTYRFYLSFPATDTDYSVTVNGVEATNVTKEVTRVVFIMPPSAGSVIVFTYDTTSNLAKAFTFGGRRTGAIGALSTAFGQNVLASGFASHAEGNQTTASGSESHAEGRETTASGYNSHAEGSNTTASGYISHAEGYYATASGNYSHAEGYRATASGGASHAEGYYTTANGTTSHAEGSNTTASGNYSHAEGYRATASGGASHAEGYRTTASDVYSHAEGWETTASGGASHAEGRETTASGDLSHAEGRETTSSGDYSHAEGSWCTASGESSHAQNVGTIAGYEAQTAIGKYNDNKSDTLLEIGNGVSDSERSNSHEFIEDGNMRIALDASATSGTDKEIYDALVALGWDSDVIV